MRALRPSLPRKLKHVRGAPPNGATNRALGPSTMATRAMAIAAVDSGAADLVALGKPFVSNPDLVHRFRSVSGLAALDPAPLSGRLQRLSGGGARLGIEVHLRSPRAPGQGRPASRPHLRCRPKAAPVNRQYPARHACRAELSRAS